MLFANKPLISKNICGMPKKCEYILQYFDRTCFSRLENYYWGECSKTSVTATHKIFLQIKYISFVVLSSYFARSTLQIIEL